MNEFSIVSVRPDSAPAATLLAELDADLQRHPYPPQSRHAFSIEKLLREEVVFFVICYRGDPAGCGGIKLFPESYGEVKRMYVRPAYRGLGLARAILDHLAQHAKRSGLEVLRLETGIYQVEAIRFYERYGFNRRAPFGEYREDPLSVYFEKSLGLAD